MSKRPLSYIVPDTPERPAKRRQMNSVYTADTSSGYQQAPEPMDEDDPMEEDEVSSTLKRDRDYFDWYDTPSAKRLNISVNATRPAGASRDNKRKATKKPLSKADFQEIMKGTPTLYGNVPVHFNKYRKISVETSTPTPKQVQVGIPEPSTSGYKMSSTSKMANTTYKYLHVDSQNRLTHETNAKVNVNFGGLPIENIKRVGVVKATITNTGHNVFQGHDQVQIAVRIGDASEFATFTLDHGYYTLTQMRQAINTQIEAYTNSNTAFREAVLDITFEESTDEKVRAIVKSTRQTTPSTQVSYALIVDHKTDKPNTLWLEMGFDKSSQTLDPQRYVQDYMTGNLHRPTNALILPSQYFGTQLWYNAAQASPPDYGKDELTAHNRYTAENTKGFYLCSQALTAGGNVLKAQVSGDGRAVVQHDDHLVYIPNKALPDEYNQYETNVIEWVDVYGDLQTFDLEVRNHLDKPLVSTNTSATSASPPFMCTLIFECEAQPNTFGADSLLYDQEAYLEAHRQN